MVKIRFPKDSSSDNLALAALALAFSVTPIILPYTGTIFPQATQIISPQLIILILILSPIIGFLLAFRILSIHKTKLSIAGKAIAILAIAIPLILVALILFFFFGLATGIISLM